MKQRATLGAAILLTLLLLSATWATAQDNPPKAEEAAQAKWQTAVPRVPGNIRLLMQDREYAKAVTAIDKALAAKDKPADPAEEKVQYNDDKADKDAKDAKPKKPRKPDYDYLIYLKARALHLQENYDDAITVYKQLEKDFPDSPWARRARFGSAVSHARKGDYLNAEIIFKKEVEFLLSLDRKQEIADIYLEFADAYFAPPKDELEKKPDYKKALEFYQKALAVGPKPDRRADVELLIAQCYQKLNNHAEAANRYQQFIKDHQDGKLAIEAKFQLGESQLKQNQHAAARRTWQDLLADHAEDPSPRIAEATYNIAKTYRVPTCANNEQLSLGVAAHDRFIEKYPDHKLASRAHLEIAQSYTNRGRYEDAVAALKRFLAQERYAQTEEVPAASNLLGQSYLQQKKFTEALAVWREYLTKHPTDKAWSNVQRAIISAEYLIGADHAHEKKYDEARKAWMAFLVKYPLDGRAARILFDFGLMNHAQEKYDEAIADWRRLVSKYPNTTEASHAQFMVGVVTEEKLDNLEEALKEYKKVKQGNWHTRAKHRIAQLTAKSMRITTERVFRSDETPRIKLTSRNIKAVKVEAYVVDLETYFRKMHLANGVEGLDIDLIDPDKKFEFKLPDFAEYQRTEHEIDIPLPKGNSGVMAVSISSKTLTATTLVIQSDLDMIIKSSRDELFVFAQNMRTGEAWPGARLLISNGSKVYSEEVTGDDGVLQKTFEQLKQAGDVRVFAIADGNVASNIVNLSGVGVAQGLGNKGYIYTDRPAYRPGQLVHVRGIIRRVAGDTYTVEKDKQFKVTVVDNRNRLVHEAAVGLSDFGSFHTHFPLPLTSPQGNYRIVATEDTKRSTDVQTYQGYFTVHQYKLQPVQLLVESDRTVYYRGEEIEGKIIAKYYYGAPLPGRQIRYQLQGGDGRVHTATTDEKGEIAFKLPTRDYAESRRLQLIASLPERNIGTAKNFFLSTQGYSLNVSTVRRIFLAGDTFETTIKAVDAEGEPIARELTLKVLEQTRVGRRVGERLVSEHKLATDKEDGTARHTLKMDKGGVYILRAEGTDRFQNPISAALAVKVSDDDDQIRLRVLADRHTYKVGEKAAVTLHWREKPALALVTYQGAKILDYQIMTLEKGANKLQIPMTARLAPNFNLSVAVMLDVRPNADDDKKKLPRRFHVASSPFAVQRQLIVEIEPRINKKPLEADQPIRPGDEVEVAITTTDPQGKPVSAEVSLAMVEQSLLKRYGPNAVAIQDFFRGATRRSDVRTNSTVTFGYQPRTRAINKRLLAEADRLLLAREEDITRAAGLVNLVDDLVLSNAPIDVAANGTVATGAISGGGGVALGGELPGSSGEAVDQYFERLSGQSPSSGNNSNNQPGQIVLGFEVQDYQQELGEQLAQQTEGFQQFRGEISQMQRDEGGGGQSQGQAGQAAPQEGNVAQSLRLDNNADAYAGARYSIDSYEMASRMQRGRMLKGAGVQYNRIAGPVDFLALADQDGDGTADYSSLIILTDGVQSNVQIDENHDGREALAKKLHEAGALVVAHRGPQETGYWNPAIVTNKKGEATIKLTVPDHSTAWKLTAKGVTDETLAGEGTAEMTARKDVFGELKLPLAFTDGDKAQIGVSIRNNLDELPDDGQKVTVTLKTTIGEKTHSESKVVNFDASGIKELEFDVSLNRSEKKQGRAVDDQVAFELTVTAGETKDVTRRTLPIKPLGMAVFSTISGSASGDATAQIAPPRKMEISDAGLQILVGPSIEQSLLDIVLGTPPGCQIYAGRLATGLDVATSDLMAAIAVQKLLAGTRNQDSPQAETLDSRIRSSISLLVSSQLDSGAWSWTGRGGKDNRYTSARAVWALSLARRAGYTVADDAMNAAVKYLQSQVANTPLEDYESKAVLIHALAAAGHEDFRVANRLYRSRQSLSRAALAYLALAFAEVDRKATANELLKLLGERDLNTTPTRRANSRGILPWNYSGTELRALCALALQLSAEPAAAPVNGETRELIDWLMAHRTGHRWSPEKATGPAALALSHWYSKTKFANEHYKLAVFVNDVRVKELDIQDDAGTQMIDVPADLLKDVNKKDTRQRVHIQITGRGWFTYQCILSGFVPADKLADTTGDWRVERFYEPAALEFDGRPVGRGFGVLQGSYTTFRNPLTQLPVGRRGRVELKVYRHNVPSGTPQEHLEYLVLTEPLPSGTSVVENSVSGGFDRYEISPGAITFYLGSRSSFGTIHYELHGYLPGSYRCAPSVVRNAYRADQIAVAKPKSLEVLPLGAKTKDKYRLTPQELWELGLKNFEKKDFKQASGHLNKLFANWNLKPDIYKRSAKMLLDIHLETGPAHKVVYYFEILKERWKDLEIPFDKVVRVGHAYHEIGEYESAYIVFRVVAESSFRRESGVAGFLQGQGEFVRSVDVMYDLLRQYPPEPYIASGTYALAQRIYAKASKSAEDAKLREQKINRIDLVRQSLAMLGNFLTSYPEDPAADQASFSVATGLLELEAYERAIELCEKYAERYPDSQWLDSYWYVIGFCHFARGEHEKALAICQKVAETRRVDRQTGREIEARNKWRAIYIMGQVYHSLGRAAEAIREYRRVKDRFVDALQAIDYFARKSIELPEVTTLRPGDDARVELTYRNVPSCDLKVYRIDLMKFSLLKRNLAEITKINLAGIRPLHEAAIELGEGKDYRDREKPLDLPIKEEGAYLIVARGENLHTSGLVLVTPLAVEIQEEKRSGRVRTTVKDTKADNYVSNVHVKVIGSANEDFVSGKTDLRGIFVADGINGKATVIAQADTGRYAFFRGAQYLGKPPQPASQKVQEQQRLQKDTDEKPNAADGQSKGRSKGGKGELLEQIFEDNERFNRMQEKELDKLYEGGNEAVELNKL